MHVADLDHLDVLSNLTAVVGGEAVPANLLTLSLKNGSVLLSLGGNPLFQTVLPQTPTGYFVSLANVPGLNVSVSRTATTGGTTNSTSIVGVLIEPGSSTSFASATSATVLR